MAEMLSNGASTFFKYFLEYKLENIWPGMVYSGLKFEVKMVIFSFDAEEN